MAHCGSAGSLRQACVTEPTAGMAHAVMTSAMPATAMTTAEQSRASTTIAAPLAPAANLRAFGQLNSNFGSALTKSGLTARAGDHHGTRILAQSQAGLSADGSRRGQLRGPPRALRPRRPLQFEGHVGRISGEEAGRYITA